MLPYMELAYVMSTIYLIWRTAHVILYGVGICYVNNISYMHMLLYMELAYVMSTIYGVLHVTLYGVVICYVSKVAQMSANYLIWSTVYVILCGVGIFLW